MGKNLQICGMETKDIFTLALGLQEPWHVAKVSFVATEGSSKELHLWLEFSKGAKFSINGSPSISYWLSANDQV